ncbi:MAG: nucleotidyl transferase AbiEii/AbiGii toxin family protein, partial [Pseudomonadales bacterium]
TGESLFAAVAVTALSYRECYAEKYRAAMTRSEIRDIYDIEIARQGGQLEDEAFVDLLRRKLAIPGNEIILSAGQLEGLKEQLDGKLQPVLKDQDYSEFDIEEAFTHLTEFAAKHGFL